MARARQYPPFRTSGVVPASGTLTLTYRTRSNEFTRATQVTAEMPAGEAAACNLRINGLLISPLVPTGDAAAGDPPIWVGTNDELTVTWAGAPVGAVGTMGVVYDLGPQ